MRKRALRCSGLGLALLVQCLTLPSRALACVVGAGTGVSCAESALNACLPGGDSFDGTVIFSCGGAATITVTSTKTVSADTTIDGGSLITISGGDSVGVFSVNTGVKFTVQNLTIANGYGGGIASAGTLTVTNSTFSGNSAGGYGAGGGININSAGTLTVTNSTFSDNSASGYNGGGGGIYSSGSGALTVTNSTFSGNSAGNYGGGGILSSGSSTLTVTSSTFSGNTASDGGGIYSYRGTLTVVTNSTFSSNSASGYGGGIINNYEGTLTVTNSTFSGNSADRGGGIFTAGTLRVTSSTFSGNSAPAGSGGAIFNYGTLTVVTNTIVANSPSDGNCAGSVFDGGHNIDDGTTCGFTGTGCTSTSGSSFCSTNPQLDPAGLANNHGPTQTIALQAGSPAINAGNESVCAVPPVNNLDQRGYVRPGAGATSCSIGAYEYNSVPASGTPTATPTQTPSATSTPTSRPTATNTLTPTRTPTITVTSTPTATPTQTPTITATNTQASGGGGCSMTSGASADGSVLWLLIPAALVAWRRQARKASRCSDRLAGGCPLDGRVMRRQFVGQGVCGTVLRAGERVPD